MGPNAYALCIRPCFLSTEEIISLKEGGLRVAILLRPGAETRTIMTEIVKGRDLPVKSTNVSIPAGEQLVHRLLTQPFVLGPRL